MIQPLSRSGELTVVMATIALLIILNGARRLDLGARGEVPEEPLPAEDCSTSAA